MVILIILIIGLIFAILPDSALETVINWGVDAFVGALDVIIGAIDTIQDAIVGLFLNK